MLKSQWLPVLQRMPHAPQFVSLIWTSVHALSQISPRPLTLQLGIVSGRTRSLWWYVTCSLRGGGDSGERVGGGSRSGADRDGLRWGTGAGAGSGSGSGSDVGDGVAAGGVGDDAATCGAGSFELLDAPVRFVNDDSASWHPPASAMAASPARIRSNRLFVELDMRRLSTGGTPGLRTIWHATVAADRARFRVALARGGRGASRFEGPAPGHVPC